MPESGGRDLLHEWQGAMQSLVSSVTSAAGRELPDAVIAPMRRQVELVEEIIERERRLQQEVLEAAFAPLDAVLDLLEQSAGALRSQAEALKESARALEQASAMTEKQAELFERTIRALREPAEIAKAAGGVGRRGERTGGGRKRG
jgi:methyl-accepting chemotaxis protein